AHWVFGIAICNIWLSLDVLYCTASIWSLVVIAFDRFTATAFPIWYREQRKRASAATRCSSGCCLSGLICLPHLVGWNGKKFINPIEKFKKSLCDLFNEKNYVLYSATGSFILPLVVMIRALFEDLRGSAASGSGAQAESEKRPEHVGRVAASQKHSSSQQQPQQHDEERPTVAINGEDASTLVALNAPPAAAWIDHQGTSASPTESVCEEEETQLQQRQQHAKRKCSSREGTSSSTGILKATIISTSSIFSGRISESSAPLSECSSSSVIFIVCWMPFTLMYLIRGLTSDSARRRQPLQDCRSGPGAGDLAGLREQRSQPILYTIFNKDFRLAFKKLT
uniref:G_PROTEIN_RECEP_F1_2 domain-containing protein n=1 Tax=Macrostomum lignano TaxID=282301 RepID=A0A1I8JLN0_9PLAT